MNRDPFLLSSGMATTLVAHTGRLLTIAGASTWSHGHRRLDWLYAHDFAIEIAPDPEQLQRLGARIWPYVQKGLPVRFSAFMPGYELGDAEPAAAQLALQRHMAMVDAVSETEAPDPVLTCRIGLTRGRGISGRRAIANLRALTAYAASQGVTVALSNLKTGPTATPERHLLWARRAGAKITLDLGHALNSGTNRRLEIAAYIDRTADRLVGVNLYEGVRRRGGRTPARMSRLGPIVERLVQTDCRWWTIPLALPQEMKATREKALGFLDRLATHMYTGIVTAAW